MAAAEGGGGDAPRCSEPRTRAARGPGAARRDEQPVRPVPAHRADPTLGERIGLRRSDWSAPHPHALRREHRVERRRARRIAIPEQDGLGGTGPWKIATHISRRLGAHCRSLSTVALDRSVSGERPFLAFGDACLKHASVLLYGADVRDALPPVPIELA